jgi:hypothetical protein
MGLYIIPRVCLFCNSFHEICKIFVYLAQVAPQNIITLAKKKLILVRNPTTSAQNQGYNGDTRYKIQASLPPMGEMSRRKAWRRGHNTVGDGALDVPLARRTLKLQYQKFSPKKGNIYAMRTL